MSLAEFCKIFQQQRSQAKPFEHISLADIQRVSEVALRDRLFDTLLVIENFPWSDLESDDELSVSHYDSGITSTYPLTLIIAPSSAWTIRAHFDTCRLAASDVTTLLDDFVNQLRMISADPQITLNELSTRLKSLSTVERIPAALSSRKQRTEPAVPPNNSLEAQVLRIWQQALGISDIGVRDTFRDVGGYSLLAVVIVSEIETTLQRKLSVTALTLETTVESLCDSLLDEAVRPDRSDPKTLKGPLLFLPAGTGDTLFYFVIENLREPDSKRHEMRAIRLEVDYTSETKLEVIAARYAKDMRATQPQGPYYLAGQYCGTSMTLEVARTLINEGEQVAFLGFVDAMPPLLTTTVTSRYLSKAMQHLKHGEWTLLVRRAFTAIKYRLRRRVLQSTSTSQRNVRPLPFRYREALGDYIPTPYPGPISLFISTAYQESSEGRGCVDLWSRIAQGGVDTTVIDGDMHPDMFQAPNLELFLQRLP